MGWETRFVAAADAVVGEEYFSSTGNDAPCYWWHRIKSVTRIDAQTVELEAGGFFTRKHPAEGITVRKWVEAAE